MITRETLELEPVIAPDEKMIGVIGVGPGAGVTTVCGLLERENRFRGGNVRVLDLGEKKETAFPPGAPARLLVVADGREGVLPEGIWEMLKQLEEQGIASALVMNRYSPSPSTAVTPLSVTFGDTSPRRGEASETKLGSPLGGELSAKRTERGKTGPLSVTFGDTSPRRGEASEAKLGSPLGESCPQSGLRGGPDITVFYIPELDLEALTALYSFAFGS